MTLHITPTFITQFERAVQLSQDRFFAPSFAIENGSFTVFSRPVTENCGGAIRFEIPIRIEGGGRKTGKAQELLEALLKNPQTQEARFYKTDVILYDRTGSVLHTENIHGEGLDHSKWWDSTPLSLIGIFPTRLLQGLVLGVRDHIAKDGVRDNLNWAPLQVESGQAQIVATNGHILASCQARSPLLEGLGSFRIGIPANGIRFISELDGSETEIWKGQDDNLWEARSGRIRIILRHVDSFPSWEQVIPREPLGRFQVDKNRIGKVLIDLKKVMAKLKNRDFQNPVDVEIHQGDLETELHLSIPDTNFVAKIPVGEISGIKTFRSRMKLEYLQQAVQSVSNGEEIELARDQNGRDPEINPVRFRSVSYGTEIGFESTSVVMPIRI